MLKGAILLIKLEEEYGHKIDANLIPFDFIQTTRLT